MGKYVQEMLSHSSRVDLQWHFFGDRPDIALRLPTGVYGNAELFELKGYRFHTWEQVGLPYRARRSKIDVLHCTATTLPFWQPVPMVVTVHDTLLWEAGGSDQYDRWYLDHLIPRALKKCSGIITISESSRHDILNLWPTLEEKLHVIPHGVGDQYLNAQNGPLSPQMLETVGTGPYFLYIGGSLERKRFTWACDVFERLGFPNLRVIACGFGQEEREKVLKNLKPALRDRIFLPAFVDEADMPHLYQNAVAVLYPTLYEGFGLPVLEAQAVGTPILFSELGSLRELKGPAAEVLPPNDMDSWVKTCRRLCAERADNQTPNEAARVWASRFSWDISAARHLDVYEKATRLKARPLDSAPGK